MILEFDITSLNFFGVSLVPLRRLYFPVYVGFVFFFLTELITASQSL